MRGNVSAGGEDVGEARSCSTVTFNELGDYVLAAVCRLETEDLVRDNYLSLELRDFSLFWQGKKCWAVPSIQTCSPRRGGLWYLFPPPHQRRSPVLKAAQKDWIAIHGLNQCPRMSLAPYPVWLPGSSLQDPLLGVFQPNKMF